MKKPNFAKYVEHRDTEGVQLDEILGFGNKDPNAPGLFASQDNKKKYAANKGVTDALPAFFSSLKELAGYAKIDKVGQFATGLKNLQAKDKNVGFMQKQVNVNGVSGTVADVLLKFGKQYGKELMQGAGYNSFDQYQQDLKKVQQVQNFHKPAYKNFSTNLNALATSLKNVVGQDHGPTAHQQQQPQQAPVVNQQGQANVNAQKPGMVSRAGSALGGLFGKK